MFVHRGFCYFNSVAIAAKQLQNKLNVSKILIVDWVSTKRAAALTLLFVGTIKKKSFLGAKKPRPTVALLIII